MARFFDFLSGGNTKVVANMIGDAHHRFGGDYASVFRLTFLALCKIRVRNPGFVDQFLNNRIPNYASLGAVQLNAGAAPEGTPIGASIITMVPEIIPHLRARNLPEQFITGNNLLLTLDVSLELRESYR